MAKVLILGKTGMLGSMLSYHLSQHHEIYCSERTGKKGSSDLILDVATNDLTALSSFVQEKKIEYIINAIGIIKPYCKDNDPEGIKKAIQVNALFPHLLKDTIKKAKIIQIATDCVYSGIKGPYDENAPHDPLDAYGKSKSLGEAFSQNMLHLRCSIIGPEKKAKLSLLEWFLSQPKGAELKGFTHHQWNGITTLRFSQLINHIINTGSFDAIRKQSSVFHVVPSYTLTKYQMLVIFNKVFKKGYTIRSSADAAPVDRRLSTLYPIFKKEVDCDFEKDCEELKKIMDGGFYQ